MNLLQNGTVTGDETSGKSCNPLYVPLELPNILGQSIILAMCLTLMLWIHYERGLKKRPWLLTLYSYLVVIVLEVRLIGNSITTSQSNNFDLTKPGGN